MKLITLKTLKMHNFMGYQGETVLEFSKKDIIGILAEYESDPTRSNRGGKTTIIEAIGYNITGVSRTKDSSKLIHHGEKEMWVTCIFTDGDKDYVLKRGRDHKGAGILELDWFQKVDEAQAEIERLFGVTKEDFHLTSFFKQADIHGFMGKTPTEKTNFLMQWLDNEHWRIKEAQAKDDRDIVKEKLRDNENLKKALEASLEIDESLESLKYELEQENKEFASERDSLQENLSAVNNDLKDLNGKRSELLEKINKLKSEKSDLDSKIANAFSDNEKYQAFRVSYASKKKELENHGRLQELTSLNTDLDKLKSRRSEVLKTLKVSKENATGVCPLVNESCDRITFDKKTIESLTKENTDISAKINEITLQIGKHDSVKRITHEMELIQEKAKRIKERLEGKDEWEKQAKVIHDKLPELSDAYSALNINDLSTNKNNITEKINALNSSIKSNSNKIFDHEVRILEAKKAKDKIDLVVTANEELQKKLSYLNYVVFMFSKNGIPALEIENSFQEIEDNINYILEELGTGLMVSFSPDKELKALEPICTCGFQFPKGFRGGSCPECDTPRQKQRKEEISFKIIENGEERDFEMDSGGGKQVVSYAVRIALTMLKRAQRKCNLNMLFLDEVDSALDPYLAAQIINSITNFLTKKLGYEQVILVSHKEQVKNAVPHVIKVVKHQTYSSASFV